ncbi:transposase, partial [Micromonospora sicca]
MSREEDDAVALVRVYCGLASADPADRPASTGSALTSAVVDDAGRLLHVCEISDDPAGYAQLVALLVERSGGPSGAAIAADSDDHTVTSLLSAAGRPLAIADDDSVDDFAERFADDDSLEEMQSPPAERRAVGLARALQAGALSAVTLPAPRDLANYKQVLAAHAALANGRHSAAVALREVLRELYPAALRAYPDPAGPVSLAVLDALPEPGMLGGTVARGREVAVAADPVAAHLVAEGVARADQINDAITALRVAISETPRRATVNRVLTSAVAETVRQAVASVRACDAACEALVGALSARVTTPAPVPGRRAAARRSEQVGELAGLTGTTATGLRTIRPAEPEPVGRRSRPEPRTGGAAPLPPRPLGPPPAVPPVC